MIPTTFKGFKMKIRLSWKLFGVMMFNVVLIVGVMVVIMNLLVSREFQGYIRANDLERFQNVKGGTAALLFLLWKLGGACFVPGKMGKDPEPDYDAE